MGSRAKFFCGLGHSQFGQGSMPRYSRTPGLATILKGPGSDNFGIETV